MTPSELVATREDIARTARQLAERGLVLGSAGNLSVRVGDEVAVTATGARFEDMTAAQVTVVDLQGTVVDGELAPTSELALHLGVYARYAAGAVVHTHSPAAITVGLVVDELPCVHYQLLLLGGAIRVAPYSTYGSAELAAGVVEALAGKAAALMANHGAVTYAGSLAGAVEHTLLLEWACGIFARAAAIGAPRALSLADQEAVIGRAVSTGYGTTHRHDPGAA